MSTDEIGQPFHSLVSDPEGWTCSARPDCDWLLIDVASEEIAYSIWSADHTHGEEYYDAHAEIDFALRG